MKIIYEQNEQTEVLNVRRFRDSDYFTTKDGRIFSIKHGEVKELATNLYNRRKDEYVQVMLYLSYGNKVMYLHRIVAECWLKDFDELLTINHKDFNKKNNNVENLESLSIGDNLRHYYAIYSTKKEQRKFKDKWLNMVFKNKAELNNYMGKSSIYAHYHFKHNPDRFVFLEN